LDFRGNPCAGARLGPGQLSGPVRRTGRGGHEHLLQVQEAEALDWTRLFRRLVGANDAERDKPAIAPVHLALADSAIPPGPDVWFVGDTDIDLACAANSGCIRVLLRAEPPAAGEFADHSPERYFATCTALADLLTVDGT
jgi:phosphoglycolate phosphatase